MDEIKIKGNSLEKLSYACRDLLLLDYLMDLNERVIRLIDWLIDFERESQRRIQMQNTVVVSWSCVSLN